MIDFVLFWWHPNTPLDLRVALAGIYLLISTVAAAAVSVLLRLERSECLRRQEDEAIERLQQLLRAQKQDTSPT